MIIYVSKESDLTSDYRLQQQYICHTKILITSSIGQKAIYWFVVYLLHEALSNWMVEDKLLVNEDFATLWKKWTAVRSGYCRGVYRR
jgi:hypothetical protein